MDIASVIVDVPTRQTDNEYDYAIPEKWAGIISPGMRVVVPFGPRKVQGFVVAMKDRSEVNLDKLKEIDSILDFEPVLTEELLALGNYLTKETLCLKITAYQALLPAALKAKYKKFLRLTGPLTDVDEQVQRYFLHQEMVDFEAAMNHEHAKLFQKELKAGHLEVHYQVENKLNKKTERSVELLLSKDELLAFKDTLKPTARKQRYLIDFFIEHRETIRLQQLLQTTSCGESAVKALAEKKVVKIVQTEVYRDPYKERHFEKSSHLPLTEEQQQVFGIVKESIDQKHHDVFLLKGVTGSGKTEVYLQSIDEVLKRGEEAIMLVPEISLTPQMVERFKGRFGDRVAVLHSGLSVGEKYDEWRKIFRKEVQVVVGARSAIFAPFQKLGLIIIDEEHEATYKQEETPRYHTRDVAIKRGEYHRCPVILGSATPTLESFARAKKGVYKLLELKNRVNSRPLPAVEIVDMREELRSGNRSVFSKLLLEKYMKKSKRINKLYSCSINADIPHSLCAEAAVK